MTTIPDRVREAALASSVPAYVYDLPGLAAHAEGIRRALPGIELYYAVKANPEAPILRTLAPWVDGFEVSSGGEIAHLRGAVPDLPLAFGGPGKTDEELALALVSGVERIHVESPHELRRLAAFNRPADILLRANLGTPETLTAGASLAMTGPFGMDDTGFQECADLLARHTHLRLRGIHAHLASGLDAKAMAKLAEAVVAHPWLRDIADPEVNVGGGMGVDYTRPDMRFDWRTYAALLPSGRFRMRIEPGRSMTAYCGWYVTEVLDLKTNHGTTYAILRGGTHHLRTPVTKGHDQPFVILPRRTTSGHTGEVTLVGQLCTPKDVFARAVPVTGLGIGDRIAFAMAGSYAWNISHHAFLMHPEPAFHYID